MALGDFLKNERRLQEEQERLKIEARERESEEKRKFSEESKAHFEKVIKPALNEIIDEFSQNGVSALLGQHIQQIVFDGSSGVMSMSLIHIQNPLQIDIVGLTITKKINVNFTYKPGMSTRTEYPLSIQEVTKEKLEELIEEELKKHKR